MLRQRVFGFALGYEDLNDHHDLRCDIALQTAVGTDSVLANQSTLCRFEQQASRLWAVAIQEAIVEQFTRASAGRRKLEAPPAQGGGQGRDQPPGLQRPLRGDQPIRQSPVALRPPLLPARRQENRIKDAAEAICRPHQLP